MNQQETEQIQAALRDAASILHEHFDKLLLKGFSHKEALELTISLQNAMFGLTNGQN